MARLTDHDFEVVCRDLFGEILDVPLELFPRGRDRGIDLRHTAADGTTTVVQCKHWPKATQATLTKRLIKDELPKVVALKPDRYLIATSVGLTVDGKDRIRDAFAPYVHTTGDLYGVDEIVAELQSRPELVRRHFRLWLSGTAVLQTVLNQEKYVRSSWLRKRIPRAAETFVPHEGFDRAKAILDEQRVCVIAGMPGVGKTTVALMLAAWLMGNGYEVHEISQDAEEITALWREDTPQLFLYDDFLGQTTLESQLNKNEDARLIDIIRGIQEAPDKALVMTTRDYILEHALLKHERLGTPDVSEATSVVHLTDLSLGVRGQILYNHVHHARLPAEQKWPFADRTVWQPIVEHRNFSPRLIEETLRLAARREQDVAAAVLKNLNEPRRIWERIVDNELTDEAVHLLEVLFTLRTAAPDTLNESWSWYRKERGLDANARTFRRALQVLDGTMVAVEQHGVSFHNPSIADYLRFHLDAGRAPMAALLGALIDPVQIHSLIDAAGMADGSGILAQLKAEAERTAAAVLETAEFVEWSPSLEDDSEASHLQWILEAAELLDSAPLAAHVVKETGSDLWYGEHVEHLVSLVDAMGGSRLIAQEDVERFAGEVADGIRLDLAEQVEAGDWHGAIGLYETLRQIPGGSLSGPPLEALVECALDGLHLVAGEDESFLDAEPLDTLLQFLFDQGYEGGADDEYAEDFAAVQKLADRFARLRDVPHFVPRQETAAPGSYSNEVRDREVITELMKGLRDPDVTPGL
ncbi:MULTISPECIES: restriction endonuclease [unclassified Streptomyces]|uniref:nSTAND3 domain-containing NTPase n=1 Tax=unclassified Streptomyces TaxID=2593676 RepID=UPI0029BCE940|nr:restriction endonuclease [Streptomyces sp. PA03-2a]MDX2733553.1 restriction endonuclease [Streptomyces sp. PA03-2a]